MQHINKPTLQFQRENWEILRKYWGFFLRITTPIFSCPKMIWKLFHVKKNMTRGVGGGDSPLKSKLVVSKLII